LQRILFVSAFMICSNILVAQQANITISRQLPKGSDSINQHMLKDSVVLVRGFCKNFSLIHYYVAVPEKIATVKAPDKIPFLTVHGNILYNFSYRSYIDTPFAESNVMQHLVQTNLNFLIKGKYPLRMTVSNRSSNSPYFKNATDVTVEFNQYQLLNNIKTDLRNKIPAMMNLKKFSMDEQLYKEKLDKAQQLQSWINSPARAQELVEEKERKLRGNPPAQLANNSSAKSFEQSAYNDWGGMVESKEINGLQSGGWAKMQGIKAISKKAPVLIDSAEKKGIDSLQKMVKGKIAEKDSSMAEKLNAKRQELTKLQAELKQDQSKIKAQKKNAQDSLAKIRQEINNLNSGPGLYAFMKRNHISKDSLTKAQRLLLSVNKIGIGRSWIDYSELTVKNISLTGVNIEMNPAPYYVAVAAGKLNYRFRDFILKDDRVPANQSLYLLRAGIGQKEKNNLIFTFYNGRKELLNNISNNSSTQKVLGFSAESRIVVDANNYLIGEFAKSSYGNNAVVQPDQSALLTKAFNYKIHTNEAYSIKLFSQYPQTDTRITAYYRKTGENFQSFNLYPVGSNQEAWMARVNQSFWKRKLTVDAAIRKNDFVSPIAAPSFDSKTIFKSLQATLRIPHYPFISVGYYPSSQLSLSNNNVLTENQYNTFNTIVSHSYSIKKIAMNTNAVYTKFYNSSNDTGFIYYNASSYTVTHSIFLNPLTLQSSIGLTDQKDLHVFTAEQLAGFQFKNKITLSSSLKWNRLNKTKSLFGGTASLGIYIKKLGTIQFNYDKIYLPGYNRVLMPVDLGRMNFYREF